MNRQQIEKEWPKIKFETLHNKPDVVGAYPPEIVATRELLLFAQVILAEIGAKKNTRFNTELYRIVMNCYYDSTKQ